jgi:hypothetical protein
MVERVVASNNVSVPEKSPRRGAWRIQAVLLVLATIVLAGLIAAAILQLAGRS